MSDKYSSNFFEKTVECLIMLNFPDGEIKHLLGLRGVSISKMSDGSLQVEVTQALSVGDEIYPWESSMPTEINVVFKDKFANKRHCYILKSPEMGTFSESFSDINGISKTFDIVSLNWELKVGKYE